MAMSPEVQEEYDLALRKAVIANGRVVEDRPSMFGWEDWDASRHLHDCGGHSIRDVEQEYWYEFASTFAGPEEGRRDGLSLEGVTCFCGLLANRTVRWDADRSEIAGAVFEIALGPKRR